MEEELYKRPSYITYVVYAQDYLYLHNINVNRINLYSHDLYKNIFVESIFRPFPINAVNIEKISQQANQLKIYQPQSDLLPQFETKLSWLG